MKSTTTRDTACIVNEQIASQKRWLQVAVVCLSSAVSFGSNFCYHNPAALKNQLQQHFSDLIDLNEYKMLFNMLYSLYSTPNIVLPFFGGYLVDRIGAHEMLLILTYFVLLGQSITAIGATVLSFRLMLVGRIIFGFGGESLGVTRTTFISTWFTKKELAFALGVSNSLAGLGGILNNVLSPYFADQFGVSFSLWFGAMTCAGSVLATVVLVPIDSAIEANSPQTLPNGQPRHAITSHTIKVTDVKHFGTVFWLILVASVSVWGSIIPFQSVASSILLERDFFRLPPPNCQRCGMGNYASYTDCHEVVPSCPPSPPFAWPLPQISASCEVKRPIDQLYCPTDPPFITDSEINCDNPIWKFGSATQVYCGSKIAAEEESSRVMSLPSMVSLIASPVLGYITGHVTSRGRITMVATTLIVATQLFIATSHVSIWALLFIQGAPSCLYFACVWPSIPYVVEEHHIGTAYGAIIAAGNLILAVMPMVVAAMYRSQQQYLPRIQLVLTGIGCVAVGSCAMLYALEHRHGRLLNPHTPQIPRARRLSQTGSLWGSSPGTSPRSISEYDQLLRRAEEQAVYNTMMRAHKD